MALLTGRLCRCGGCTDEKAHRIAEDERAATPADPQLDVAAEPVPLQQSRGVKDTHREE